MIRRLYPYLFATLLSIAHTTEAKPLIVGYVDYPPCTQSTDTEEGYLSGGDCIETTRAAIAEIGREAEFVRMPIKRLLHKLYSGEVDIVHLLMNYPLARERVLFSNAPLYITRLNVYSLPGQPPIDSIYELQGQSVITILGYTYGGISKFIKHPDSGIKTLDVKTHEAGLLMLQAKRAPYLLDYEGTSSGALQKLRINKIQQQTLMVTPITWVVSRATPDAEQLVLDLNNAFQRLSEENRLP